MTKTPPGFTRITANPRDACAGCYFYASDDECPTDKNGVELCSLKTPSVIFIKIDDEDR